MLKCNSSNNVNAAIRACQQKIIKIYFCAEINGNQAQEQKEISKLGNIIMVILIKVYIDQFEVCSALGLPEGGVLLLLLLFISSNGVFVF